MILDFNRNIQRNNFTCGHRSVFGIAKHFGLVEWTDVKRISKELGIYESDGTTNAEIKKLIRAVGLRYRTIENLTERKIRNCINKGYPILCSIDNEKHWSVIKGIDLENIYMNDSSIIRTQKHSIDDFISNVLDADVAYEIGCTTKRKKNRRIKELPPRK